MTTTPENKPDEQARGARAQSLLDNPVFKEAMAAVKGTYTKAMIETDPDNSKDRDHFHRCIRAMDDVEAALTIFVRDGKIDSAMKVKQERAKK